jgi:hypothetical protein
LASDLKDRFKTGLNQDQLEAFELESQRSNQPQKPQQSNSMFKVPIFQPTIAAAMYNIQHLKNNKEECQINSNSKDSRSSDISLGIAVLICF